MARKSGHALRVGWPVVKGSGHEGTSKGMARRVMAAHRQAGLFSHGLRKSAVVFLSAVIAAGSADHVTKGSHILRNPLWLKLGEAMMRRWMLVFLQLFGINTAHAQSEPAENWEQYLTRMGDKTYAVRVDIGLYDHAPMADRSQRLRVLLHLKNPSRPEDGLPFPGEAPELARIENALKAAMKTQCGARYAGRMTGNGGLAMYFYTPDCQHVDAVVNETMRQFSSYRFEAAQITEPSWKTYFEHLHPGLKGLRQMMNSRMFDMIEKRIENSGAVRIIDHAAFFKSAEARKRFIEEIARHSFIVGEQQVELDAKPFTFAVHFQREDALQREAIDEVTMQLEDLAAQHEGRYDGWGALAGQKR